MAAERLTAAQFVRLREKLDRREKKLWADECHRGCTGFGRKPPVDEKLQGPMEATIAAIGIVAGQLPYRHRLVVEFKGGTFYLF